MCMCETFCTIPAYNYAFPTVTFILTLNCCPRAGWHGLKITLFFRVILSYAIHLGILRHLRNARIEQQNQISQHIFEQIPPHGYCTNGIGMTMGSFTKYYKSKRIRYQGVWDRNWIIFIMSLMYNHLIVVFLCSLFISIEGAGPLPSSLPCCFYCRPNWINQTKVFCIF